MKNFKLPIGTCDYLPGECGLKNAAEESILGVFKKNGYDRIETPSIEYADVFDFNRGFPEENSFKLTDTDGSLLVLRPDLTMPLKRIVATKLKDSVFPLKLCYLGNSFNLFSNEYRYREFTQAGLELIGEASYLADAEAVILAIEALKEAGLSGFLIEIGNTEFFKGILEECRLSESEEASLTRAVDRKNNPIIEEILKRAGVSDSLISVVTALSTLFGGREAIDKAYKTAKNKRSLSALEELKKLYGLLDSLGYGEYISVDLGLLNRADFYTGTVFKGLSGHFGAPILAGGRYDRLYTAAGSGFVPATGFAIGIKNLITALTRSGNTLKKRAADYVIGCGNDSVKEAFEKKAELTAQGYTVSFTFIKNLAKLKRYAESVGAGKALFIK